MTSASGAARAALSIVVDQPTSDLGLGYDKYVDALASVTVGGTPARFTVGIYGAWGVGKSSILKALEKKLAHGQSVVVNFDAWRYGRNPNVIVPLLHEIEESLSRVGGKDPLWKSVGRGLRAVTAEMSLSAGFFSVSGGAIGSAYDAFSDSSQRRRAEVPHYRLTEIGEDLTAGGKRIIVLVDDLDRCAPDSIIQVLEAMHVLTDVQGFVFVLALDYDVLISAVEARYPDVDAALFIEKIIQIPFWIPEVDRAGSFVSQVVPGWKSLLKLDEPAERALDSVVRLALRTNPRQVKRLVNSMLIAKHILGDTETSDTNQSVLLAVIGLQLRWPAQFKALHIALASDPDTETLSEFSAYSDPVDADDDLELYLREVIPPALDPRLLLAAMKYSRTTASAAAQITVDSPSSGGLEDIDEFKNGPHGATFQWVHNLLIEGGLAPVIRQQYIAYKGDRRALVRVEVRPVVGVRLFFPDSMKIDHDDAKEFAAGSGARATNFQQMLVVKPGLEEIATKYLERTMGKSNA